MNNSSIIFLKNIFYSKLNQKLTNSVSFTSIDDQSINKEYDNSIDKIINQNTDYQYKYSDETIPNIYINNDIWPKQTNILCWNCNMKFDNQPKFIPIKLNKNANGEDEFDVLGNFCSLPCSIRYLYDYIKDLNKKYEYEKLIKYLYKIRVLYPANDKITLNKFGGRYTESQYIKQNEDIEESMN